MCSDAGGRLSDEDAEVIGWGRASGSKGHGGQGGFKLKDMVGKVDLLQIKRHGGGKGDFYEMIQICITVRRAWRETI